jgi:hypothetical protein
MSFDSDTIRYHDRVRAQSAEHSAALGSSGVRFDGGAG